MAKEHLKRGGARPNAGRPKGIATIEAEQFRINLAKRIKKNATKWMDAIEDLALGHKEMTSDGEVYTKAPDPIAWQKGTDRAFGKSPETLNHLNDGGSFEVNIITYKPEHDAD